MAMIEMNALSTVLCGSFSAKVFFPEMDKLELGENDYDKNIRYCGYITVMVGVPWTGCALLQRSVQ